MIGQGPALRFREFAKHWDAYSVIIKNLNASDPLPKGLKYLISPTLPTLRMFIECISSTKITIKICSISYARSYFYAKTHWQRGFIFFTKNFQVLQKEPTSPDAKNRIGHSRPMLFFSFQENSSFGKQFQFKVSATFYKNISFVHLKN